MEMDSEEFLDAQDWVSQVMALNKRLTDKKENFKFLEKKHKKMTNLINEKERELADTCSEVRCLKRVSMRKDDDISRYKGELRKIFVHENSGDVPQHVKQECPSSYGTTDR